MMAVTDQFLLLFLGSLLSLARPQPAPYVTFMGSVYPSYACIDLAQVGEEESNGVQCHTDLHTCCTSAQGLDRGDWYPPDSGSSLPFFSEAAYIYQKWGDMRVDLYRRDLDSAGDAGQGVYYCAIETVAQNPSASWDVSGRATVYVELRSGGCPVSVDPTITLSQNPDFGDTPRFQLTCISTGTPSVTWTRNSVYVSAGQTTVSTTTGPSIQFIHTLTVTERLGGLYACTAAGGTPPTNSASFYIQVASAPTDLRAVQVGLREVRLTWVPPSPLGETNGYNISYYYSPNSIKHSLAGDVGGSTDNFLVTELLIRYNYTVVVTGASKHFFSEPVTTHVYVAPVGTPEHFKVIAAQREVTFSWSPPRVSAPISNYTLSCQPPPPSFPLAFSSPGLHSVTGFSPNTEYSCSVAANYSSSVSGVPATVDFTTEADYYFFEVTFAGYIYCFDWLDVIFSAVPLDRKLQDIRDQIAEEVANSCNCDFTSSHIDQEELSCSDGSTNSLNYTARLTSTFFDIDSSELVGFLDDWVASGPTVTVEGVLLRALEEKCTGVVSVSSDVCPNHRKSGEGSSNSDVRIGAPIAAALVLVAIVSGGVVIGYVMIHHRRQRQGSANLPRQPQQVPQQQPVISNSRGQDPPLLPLADEEG